MLKLIKFLKNYKLEAFLSPLFKLFEASFELLVPLIIANIIDIGIASKDKNYILIRGAVLILLSILGLAFAITAQYFAAKASVGFGAELRQAVFEHLSSLAVRDIKNIGEDSAINRIISDTNQIQSGVNLFFRIVLRSPFIVIGAVIMAFFIHVEEALIFFLLIVALSIVVYFFMKRILIKNKLVQKGLDSVFERVDENLSGARVIRAFRKTEDEKKDFEVVADRLLKAQYDVGLWDSMLSPITILLVNTSVILVIYTGAIQVNIGSLTQGQVVALVNYMSQILIELLKIAHLVILLSKSSTCAGRIQAMFDIKGSIDFGQHQVDEALASDVLLEFKDVSFSYTDAKGFQKNSKKILEDISFSLSKGESLGIIGVTASGKTSLVNLILRLEDPDSGTIKFLSKDIKSYTKESLLNAIRLAQQDVQLFKGSIAENIAWTEDFDSNEMDKAIDVSQSKDFIYSKEDTLYYSLDEGAKNLSGGQRQRLSIARALYKSTADNKTKLIILDDVSSALDYITELKLRQALSGLKDMSFIIVSQRVSSIMHLDKIMVLDEGRIQAIGRHEELIKSSTLYREICSTQLQMEDVEYE